MTVVLDLPDNCGVINISAVFDNPPRGYTFTNWAISPRKVAMITHDGSPHRDLDGDTSKQSGRSQTGTC